MKTKTTKTGVNLGRRKLVRGVAALGGAVAGAAAATRIAAAEPAAEKKESTRFPGDPPEHRVVYQFNKADREYMEHIVFSVGALLRQYNDNVKIVVTAFGPGIHVLLKKPQRPVPIVIREKIASLHEYGVEFHACGNTLEALKLTEKDTLPFAKYVQVGAADLMELQEQGYAYLSW